MLPFFTNPYPDELIYSAIARYHFYSGNIDFKDTLEEVFLSRSVIPNVEIGSQFTALAQQLGSNYSAESLIADHTIYPYYSLFLSKQRQKEIMNDIKGNGQGLYTRLGLVAGSICKKDGLYYCNECAKQDVEQYGEPYIHREHQLQGIDYCSHHEVMLKKYSVDFNMQSRIEFIRFESEHMELSPFKEVDETAKIQITLAKMAYQLLKIPLNQSNRENVALKYRAFLRERNLVTASNRVRQSNLHEVFQAKVPTNFLEKYESTIDESSEYNWLKVLTRSVKRHVHPFRHLLMMLFLEMDISSFIKSDNDIGPFGKGPWPCLNKAAIHYKQPIVTSVEVTRDFKSKSPIGTFTCSCGFIFARKGPDRIDKDRYQIGRVKVFGHVWKKKLQELSKQSLSIRAITRELNVDSKTVKKYLKDFNEVIPKEKSNDLAWIDQYREEIVEGIKHHKDLNRTQIREQFPKQYIYLYRNDREWLFKNLPIKKRKNELTKIVDWVKRDGEYCRRIQQLYQELVQIEKPIRITKSIIGKRLGILANLERNLDKLPQTEKLLLSIVESVQDFQIRRCYKIIDTMLKGNETVLLWRVRRVGGLRPFSFFEIQGELESYLQEKLLQKGLVIDE
ncbi:TnsD family transposase [Psychrobacillus psychrodurans]|nr:TnsD family transposase [Psychrobacillus psychrodurans]